MLPDPIVNTKPWVPGHYASLPLFYMHSHSSVHNMVRWAHKELAIGHPITLYELLNTVLLMSRSEVKCQDHNGNIVYCRMPLTEGIGIHDTNPLPGTNFLQNP